MTNDEIQGLRQRGHCCRCSDNEDAMNMTTQALTEASIIFRETGLATDAKEAAEALLVAAFKKETRKLEALGLPPL